MRPRVALVLLLLLLTACGLPLPDGVQSAGQVQPQRAEPAVVEVLPPGPVAGASPEQVLRGFLNAQSSPDDDHAVAREFLAPDTTWDDEAGAIIYELGSIRFSQDPGDPTSFAVRVSTTGRISPEGSFSRISEPQSRAFTLARQPDGQFRLVKVPDGLLLPTGDRDRSFRAADVHFLALSPDGSPSARLVPDRVFLPVTADPAQALLERLLDGPSAALAGAVASALPAGTTAKTSVTEGVVSLDLSEQVLALDNRARQRLAAQVVWTLTQVPTYSGVRLLVEGEPLDLPGEDGVQNRVDWGAYDPSGGVPEGSAPLYYVRDRMLRTLGGTPLPQTEATGPGGLAVDQMAVSPSGRHLALISRGQSGDVLHVGPPDGPFTRALLKRGLSSPSWGSGTYGAWVLEPGPRPVLWLVPGPGAPEGAQPQSVRYPQPAGAGPLSAVQVSRDGARIAMVFGSGAEGRLFVGHVEPTAGRVQVIRAEPVAPELVDVIDVAWQSGTALVVLASRAAGPLPQLLLWTVSVDGSTAPAPVPRQGLTGTPRSVAAMAGQPLVVAAELDGRSVLFRESGALLLQNEAGAVPVYAG